MQVHAALISELGWDDPDHPLFGWSRMVKGLVSIKLNYKISIDNKKISVPFFLVKLDGVPAELA